MVMIWRFELHLNWQNYVLLIVICCFVTQRVYSWNPNLIVDNEWVNGYDVNDNDRNDVLLTIIEIIWRWKNNELMILMRQLLNEMFNFWKWNSRNGDDLNIEFTLQLAKLYVFWLWFYFVTETMNLWNRNLVDDNGWVNGYDVNDNDRNDVLTIIDFIWRWKQNELMILMWHLLNEMLNLWNWNSWNGDDMNVEFTLKLAKLYIIDCDLLFCNRNDQLIKSKFDCW